MSLLDPCASLLFPAMTHLPRIDVAGAFDGHDVCVFSKDLVEHRVMELALGILMEGELYNVPQVQLCTRHGVLVELLDVGHDVAEVIDCTVDCTGLRPQ